MATPFGTGTETAQFTVEPGWGSTEIADALRSRGLIRNATLFKLHVWRQGVSTFLQSGEYFFSPSMSIAQIAAALSTGEGTTKERSIRIIEGWNIQEIAAYLEAEDVISAQDFINVVQHKAPWWDGYAVLSSRSVDVDLEGYLFPDTYRIFRDATTEDIVRKMLDTMERKFTPEMRAAIAGQGSSIHEILTLASIIEKEVRGAEDRGKVADIFYRRIAAGIPLQADSTVNYVTGKDTPSVSAQDLQIDSPYNTYKYRGLPPGPIASSALSAIQAAITPIANPYWFFLTTPDGVVIYSRTHDEHVAAKAKYL